MIPFRGSERDTVHHQHQMPGALLLNEQQLFLQPELAPQPDSSIQPNLHLMTEGQIHPPRQFIGCYLPADEPLGITILTFTGSETELALGVHKFRSQPAMPDLTTQANWLLADDNVLVHERRRASHRRRYRRSEVRGRKRRLPPTSVLRPLTSDFRARQCWPYCSLVVRTRTGLRLPNRPWLSPSGPAVK